MKFEFELRDIEAIAERVAALLKPCLSSRAHEADDDKILDVGGLAKYLGVDIGWVYKQVSLKAFPYFKSGKYTRFRKRDIDRWIASQTVNPISSLNSCFKGIKNKRWPHDK